MRSAPAQPGVFLKRCTLVRWECSPLYCSATCLHLPRPSAAKSSVLGHPLAQEKQKQCCCSHDPAPLRPKATREAPWRPVRWGGQVRSNMCRGSRSSTSTWFRRDLLGLPRREGTVASVAHRPPASYSGSTSRSLTANHQACGQGRRDCASVVQLTSLSRDLEGVHSSSNSSHCTSTTQTVAQSAAKKAGGAEIQPLA